MGETLTGDDNPFYEEVYVLCLMLSLHLQYFYIIVLIINLIILFYFMLSSVLL
jgi:hypothetical protein